MAALTDKGLETFAQALAYGFTVAQAAEESDLSVSPVEASHLAANPEIMARVEELTRSQIFDMTNEHFRIAQQLVVDRDFAYKLGNPAAAINATVQRAKILGVYIERFDTVNKVAVSDAKQLTPEEWSEKFAPKTPSQGE